MSDFISELKRRNVFRVAGVYTIVSWLLAQIATTLEDVLSLPPWFDSAIVAALLLGFPVALLFAWAFELTPNGLKRSREIAEKDSVTGHTGRKLDFVIIAILILVIGYFAFDKLSGSEFPPDMVQEQNGEGTSIAVLAFADMSPDRDQEYFSDGISEEILNVLAKTDRLRVISRSLAVQSLYQVNGSRGPKPVCFRKRL